MLFLTLVAGLCATATITETSTTPPDFSPDRPGFADSAGTVPRGYAQLEVGLRASFEDDATLLQTPSILLRVGISELAELRVIAPDVVLNFAQEGENSAGVKDVVLGLKVAGHIDDLFGVSLVPFFTLPTGTIEESTNGIDVGAGLNFELTPTEDLQIGWNVIGAFLGDTDPSTSTRTFNTGAGLSLGYQFTNLLGAFVEGYVLYEDDGVVLPSVAGGVTYLLGDSVQLDLSGGTGLRDGAEGPYAIAGAAFLL